MTQNTKNAEKIVGFDLDGVIIDHSSAKILLANKFGFTIDKENTSSDKFKLIIPKSSLREIQSILYDKTHDQPLFNGAKQVLMKMIKNKTKLYLISRRRAGVAREMAIIILKKRGLWPQVFNEKNVYFVETPEEKNLNAGKLGVTHYIDDEKGVLAIINSVPNKFLFDPFNTGEKSDYYKVNTWKELEKIIS